MTTLPLIILAEAVDVGWVGGGAVGGISLIGALIALWKQGNASNQAVIEAHKLRADEAEKRTKEVTEVLATETSTRKAFAESMGAVAAGITV